MKIVLAGYKNPLFPTITEFCEEALRTKGHEVLFFHDRNHRIPSILTNRLSFLKQFDLQMINDGCVAQVAAHKPDLFLALGGVRILPETVDKIKAAGVATALWTIDAPVDFSAERRAAPRYDHVFCGGSEAEEILHRDGVNKARWLPFAMDATAYHPMQISDDEREKLHHDVLFIGSYYPNRWELLRQLAGFNVGIYGPGWARAGIFSSGGISIHDTQLHFSDQMKLYASAGIVVVIHYQDGTTPCYQASPKVYEALACNRFVLVDRQKDVFSLFKDGEHLVGFDSVDDLKQKVRYFLDRPGERQKIAETGYREATSRHTYRHRIEEMMQVISSRPKPA